VSKTGVDPQSYFATKKELRRRLAAARRELSVEQREREEAVVVQRLERIRLSSLGWSASYLATADEMNLQAWHQLLWDAGRPVALPRVVGPFSQGQMEWHAVWRDAGWQVNRWGIREPDPAQWPIIDPKCFGVLAVPGLGFTTLGARLGQGGGFYDRLLSQNMPRLLAVGVGFSVQMVDEVPLEQHDVRVAQVLSGKTPARL
jgi:5-formyltetrahydrofolate cyclo-ligase